MSLSAAENNYIFTNDWFKVSELCEKMHLFVNTSSILEMLEIGSFEGQSTCFFLDKFCTNPASTLVAVDPFQDKNKVVSQIYRTFLQNVSKSSRLLQLKCIREFSDKFFAANKRRFDFIYVDGSHEPMDVVNDVSCAIACAKKGGIVWIDDYILNPSITFAVDKAIGRAVDSHSIEIIHQGKQLGLRVW